MEAEAAAAEAAAKALEEAGPPKPTWVRSEQTRWIIPAHGSVDVYVQFMSPNTGRFATTLGFEIQGSTRGYHLDALARCVCLHVHELLAH